MEHYCDRCGAIAKMKFVFGDGKDLSFCGHHTNEYMNNLLEIVEDVIELDKLPIGV